MRHFSASIRPAVPQDRASLVELRNQTWEDDPCSPSQVMRAFGHSDHALLVAVTEDGLCGFVDAFLTRSRQGTIRWEVDLLAVHPAYRNRGIGKALVMASLNAARHNSANLARALIREENTASQQVFAACGFTVENERRSLYVWDSQTSSPSPVEHEEGYFIEVDTINYHGIWLEEVFTRQAFQSAALKTINLGADIAGAVLPAENAVINQSANRAGYRFAGNYRWWYHRL